MSLIHSSFETNKYDYYHKANHIKDDCYILKMKIFYEKYHSSLALKKLKSLKLFHLIRNVACYESDYSIVVLYIESFIMSNLSLNILVIDFEVFNYMISLNKSCFMDYSIDLPGSNIIMRIKRNIKVLDIDIITL